MLTMCSLWLTSCTSTPVNRTAPDVVPPDPYDSEGRIVWQLVPAGQTITAKEEGVFIPYWYFEKLFDYIVDTQAALKIINGTGKKND